MRAVVLGLAAATLAGLSLAAQDSRTRMRITAHVVEPQKLALTPEATQQIEVPDGFRVTRFAEGLEDPRMLAVAPDGAVYVTRRDNGDVLLLPDADGDGVSEAPKVIARRPQMHGIAVDGTKLYLTTVTEVFVADRKPDGTIGELRRIIDDLPHAGQHPNRTIGVGPDGQLYISVGSTCNACDETSPEFATMLRARPDGSSRTIFASGLRNTIGFAWHPTTGALWGMDHGIDWLGDDDQPEELNEIAQGKQFGWPYIYADGKVNPQDEPPGGIPAETWARMSTVPTLMYTAHAAPMQMAFYTGQQFPDEYRHDAFVAMRGSWNREQPSGYEVVRVRFEHGRPVKIEPFMTGLLVQQGSEWKFLGRPAGIAVARDGALLVADDENGVVYRISHEAGAKRTTSTTAPTGGAAASTTGVPTPPPARRLTMADVPAKATLQVRSTDFARNGTMPREHSDYGQKISPALSWSGAPAGTASFVVLAEDPDAKEPKPFVHWVLYDLPAEHTQLPQAVSPLPRLTSYGGALQGRTSRGNIGYFGPRPPTADPAHHYHFQVFALDATLKLDPGATADQVRAAMRGHVLAAGEVVGTFKAPPDAR